MLEVRLLGQFDVQVDRTPVKIPLRVVQRLFAYLLCNAGVEQRRERLAGMFWPDTSEAKARDYLRNALWHIGKSLAPDSASRNYLLSDKDSVTFNHKAGYWFDVAILLKKTPTSQWSPETLIEAVSVYGGEFFPGVDDDWAVAERTRLRNAYESKMHNLLDRLVGEERWPEVLDWGERWIKLSHAPEPAYRALMEAYGGLGDMQQVALTYQRCLEALDKELGVDPSAQTRLLYDQLLQGKKTIWAPTIAPPSPVSPPPAPQPARQLHNLPPQATPFIGRDKELSALAQMLAQPDCRLVTLVGPGGIGKTRLSLQAAAAQFGAFPDGVYFVPLAPVGSHEFLAHAIADAIKFSFYGQDDPKTQLVNYLREKQMILVMDNYEHLIENTNLIEDILSNASKVKLVITSRERLHLRWEWIQEIEGLEFPGNDENAAEAEHYSAVQLFLQTARRQYPRFSTATELPAVIRLCQLVEGMPLALEMAAARVRVHACAEIVQQIERNLDPLTTPLRDTPERHRSMRAVFEHSWSLLSAEEKRLFRKLSVFRGSFRREAMEKVAGAPLALLLSLVDKSFVGGRQPGRYELHELLKQYAAEKLDELAEEGERPADVYAQMAGYYLEFATLNRQDYAELEREWDNLAAGLEAAYQQKLWQAVVDYTNALPDVWFARARFTDARRGYQWACEAAQALDNPGALASALCQWGRACVEQGDHEEAERHLHESAHLCQQVGDTKVLATGQYFLGRIAVDRADYDRALTLFTECQRLREQRGDWPEVGEALYMQAVVKTLCGLYAEAEELGKQALSLQQAASDKRGQAPTLRHLAQNAMRQNAYSVAETYSLQALALAEEIRDTGELASTLYVLSIVRHRLGHLEEARRQAETSLTLFRQMGDRQSHAHALFQLSLIHKALQNYPLARETGQQSLMLYQALQYRYGEMKVLEHLGEISKLLRQPVQARQAWLQALHLAQTLPHQKGLVEVLENKLAQLALSDGGLEADD